MDGTDRLKGTCTVTRQLEPDVALQCMEVWGGNRRSFRKVEMHGLDAWVSTVPFEGEESSDGGGGDVHYLSSCGTGRIIRILVADVSGHGDEVAQVARELAVLMRRHVNTLDQNLFVQGLNGEFKTLIQRGQFATAVAATFFAPTRELEVTNAGHPRPLVFRRDDASWAVLEGPGIPKGKIANLPLGILDEVHYYSHSSSLDHGDFVLLYSDAVTEAARPDGTQLDEHGLLDLVSKLDPREGSGFLEALVTGLESWRQGPLDDDETLLLLSPNGREPETSLSSRVRLIGVMLRGFVQAIRRGEKLPLPDFAPANVGGAMIPLLSRIWSRKDPRSDSKSPTDR